MKTINPESYQHLVTGINCNANEFVQCSSAAEHLYHSKKMSILVQVSRQMRAITSLIPFPDILIQNWFIVPELSWPEDFSEKIFTEKSAHILTQTTIITTLSALLTPLMAHTNSEMNGIYTAGFASFLTRLHWNLGWPLKYQRGWNDSPGLKISKKIILTILFLFLKL